MPCDKCGCTMFPCRCEFDNEWDFFKYGECFVEIFLPKPEPGPLTKEAFKGFCKKIEKWPSYPLLKPPTCAELGITEEDIDGMIKESTKTCPRGCALPSVLCTELQCCIDRWRGSKN